ncbi:MAG: hypothetical protein MUC65_07300 [Pontiellaceae bacterium]|jgi:mevalonate kinase|nr:hypothetical protein [Pontiellaceae bacterium]
MTDQSAIFNLQSAIQASAPGSLMLLGEHAVLHGRRAMVCAINKRITVRYFQTLEKNLRIVSDLGTYEAPLDALTDHPHFRFVLDVVRQYPPGRGMELKIESEFSSEIGFGSSAAVTVAAHAVLMKLAGSPRSWTSATEINDCRAGAETPPFLEELFKRSLATIHRVQGRGSGADVAASVFGGAVAYRAEPLEIHPLEKSFPLTAVYSGSKMKTAEVIALVEIARAMNPEKYERIYDRMDALVGEVLADFSMLGKALMENQKLMEDLNLCNNALAEIIRIFQVLNIPAKISGSGLGDCAIGLGQVPAVGTFPVYALKVEPKGVKVR